MNFSPNKKVIAVIVLAGLLPVALIVIATARAQAKTAQTVRLTNGKSVYLSQSVASLKSTMASDFIQVRPGIFRYPADTKKPAQVDVYTDNNQIVGILVGRNINNFQAQNKAHLGMTGTSLSKLFGGRLQAINTAKDFVKQRGYKVGGLGVVSYYLTQTCAPGLGDNIRNGDNVVYLAVVKPGGEKMMKFLNRPLQCVAPSKQTAPPPPAPAKS